MAKIKSIKACEILDSRGNPTIETTVILEGDLVGKASVPSGSSIGQLEALELRDNDPKRYHGMGVLKAVSNVNLIIAPKLIGLEARDQLNLDRQLITLDGTENKSNLGANALLSVSIAVCKAGAACEKVPPYEHIGHLAGLKKEQMKIPQPIFNLINGGKHGAGNLDFQEFPLIPSSEKKYPEALRLGAELYFLVKQVLIRHNAIHSVGDEGGFAPNLFTNLDALEVIMEAIKDSGYVFRKDVFLGLDVAPAFFYKNNRYQIKDRSSAMSVDDLIQFYQELINLYPLFSLEDPFIETDWESWTKITQLFPDILIIGDDLLTTNKKRVEEAIKRKACRAILVKPNQIGTLAETIEVVRIAKQAGWKIIVSHRSGETGDDFIADFGVGVGADMVKFGAPARGERVAKYNRLLKIYEELQI